MALALVLSPAATFTLAMAQPDTTVTLEAWEDPEGSCPWVFTWNGSEYVQDNDVYSTARGADKEFTDYYTLNKPLVPKDGEYSLELRELTKETSYTDLVQLLAVDHASDVNIASDENGDVWTYSNPSPPVSAVDNEGEDVLGQIATEDDSGFKGYHGDYVVLDFGDLQIDDSAILVLRVNGFEMDGNDAGTPIPARPYVFIQTQNSSGDWVTRHSFYPREDWSISAYNLADYLGSSNMVRLYVTSCLTGKYQVIDYVGLDTSAQSPVTIHTLSATSAVHSVNGDVLDEISDSDNDYAEMSPDGKMAFTFPVPEMAGEARDFVLVSEGYYIPAGTFYLYTWDGSDWVERYDWSVASFDDQTSDFDMSDFLPDPDGEDKVRIYQSYTYEGEAGIDYVGISRGDAQGVMTYAHDLKKDEDVLTELKESDDVYDEWAYEEVGDRWVEVEWTFNRAKADFSAEPPMGEAPLTVQFTDLSRGDIDRDGYFWSFGDGETSTERDTTHTYQNEGIYDVSLTVTGPGGTDSASGQVIVEGAATIAKLVVRNLNITPAYVYPRQAVTVSANVVNEGGGWGSETVDLMINGYVEQSRGVGVSPGTAYPVSFTVYEVPAGEYQVTIGDATGVFYVMEEAAAAPSGGILPAGELSSGSIVAIIVIGIIVIGGVVVVVMFAGGRR